MLCRVVSWCVGAWTTNHCHCPQPKGTATAKQHNSSSHLAPPVSPFLCSWSHRGLGWVRLKTRLSGFVSCVPHTFGFPTGRKPPLPIARQETSLTTLIHPSHRVCRLVLCLWACLSLSTSPHLICFVTPTGPCYRSALSSPDLSRNHRHTRRHHLFPRSSHLTTDMTSRAEESAAGGRDDKGKGVGRRLLSRMKTVLKKADPSKRSSTISAPTASATAPRRFSAPVGQLIETTAPPTRYDH